MRLRKGKKLSPLATGSPFKQAAVAAKANLAPAALLWAAAVGLIVAYYHHCPTAGLLDRVAELKVDYGYAYSAIGTPIFAVLLPLLIQRVVRAVGLKGSSPEPWRHVPLLVAFWAYRGAEIDLLYRFQEWLWGGGEGPARLAGKVLIDQGGYVMCWAIPTMMVTLLFKDCGYSIRRTRGELGRRWYRRRCAPLLVVNWVVWLPAVVVIYLLPLGLRIPVMNLNVCLFMLLVMFATKKPGAPVVAP